MTRKITISKDVYLFTIKPIKTYSCIYLIPSLYVMYEKRSFLETGVYTPRFTIGFNFLRFIFFIDLQKAY